MKRMTMTALMTAALFFMSGSAFAQVDEATAPGEVHIKLSLAYAKVLVNGEEWDNTEFTNNGKTLIVRGIDRSKSNEFTVEASEEGFAVSSFTIDSRKKYKKKRKKRVVSFVANKTIKFKKEVLKKGTADKRNTPAAADEGTRVKNQDIKAKGAIENPRSKGDTRRADPSKVRAPKKR